MPETMSGEQVRCILHISKRKCAWMLNNGFIEMTEEKGLPKHLASLPENADKLVNDDFFGEVNAYETGGAK